MAKEPNDPWESDFIDDSVARAIAHPMRAHILAEANVRVLSPSQFAQRHELDLSTVSYHFRQLEKYDCLEVIAEKPVRGAVQHFYKATRRALFEGKAWESLPENIRNKVSGRTISDLLGAISEAMLAETFDERKDRHLVWKKCHLDEQGWREVSDIWLEAFQKASKASSDSHSRLLRSGEEGIMATWAMTFFLSPPAEAEEQGQDPL